MPHPSVRFQQHAIFIHNIPVVVLCGSVFYFRIPRALWHDRLQKIKAAGYNCIDVYFPWNYHELVEGGWDFSGERDVDTFLQMAVEAGLWIIARPGPYICSEWDGGALPAYLPTYPGMRLRDNDDRYLGYVANWFEHIFPILEKFQVTPQGGIIMVQLENELDFFDCADRAGYMSALRDMAQQYDIRVPLIACAGQGDLSGATGDVAGIVPTGNFYPDLNDLGIEAKVSFYRRELAAQQIPLMVTETHRAHLHLRRLLSCGVKLFGPYNQVAGNDFGFTNAVNNWGNPLAFLTTEYDFDSMITWTGALRQEFFEGRLLSGLLTALGEPLAQATPLDTQHVLLDGDLVVPDDGPYGLKLSSGGSLLALPNLSDTAATVTLQTLDAIFPRYSTLTVPPLRCPFVLQRIPLQQWQCEGTLVYSTAELGRALSEASGTTLVFYTDGTGEMAFALPDDVEIETDGMTMHVENTQVTCCFTDERISTAVIQYRNGRRLRVFGMNRTQAGHLERVTTEHEIVWNTYAAAMQPASRSETPLQPDIHWTSAGISESGGALFQSKIRCNSTAKHLEEVGILRGYGWYGARTSLDDESRPEGFLLHDAGDVVSLYVNDMYHGTVIPGGGTAYLPVSPSLSGPHFEILARAEIWGHSNFDDICLPAIRLNSLRGVRDITLVTARYDLSKNWRFLPVNQIGPESIEVCLQQNPERWIVLDWASWMTAQHPHRACFRKQFSASKQANSWTLHFPNIQCQAQIYVNGQDFGMINPHNPYVNISALVRPGEVFDLAIFTEQAYDNPGGTVLLLEGTRVKDWWIGGANEADFVSAATTATVAAMPDALPFRLPAGNVSWLCGALPDLKACHTLAFSGQNAKITVIFNGRLVGRIWLPSGVLRPAMKGGMADNRVYLPGPWFATGENHLACYVEAVVLGEDAEITGVELNKELVS